jgi:EAL domain-containing protein (putative c-di-GMP-specific phosphodiesterase class I)
MQATLETRAALESDLYQALAQNQFLLYYQAQINATGNVTGAEALLRWNHPQRGLVAPDEFIPLAEESDLIVSIGQWVMETACAQLKQWQSSPLTRGFTLSVNVSARQFRDKDFVRNVRALIDRSGIDPTHLKLEITESMLLDKVDLVIDAMGQLKLLGVGFSMDDFGTGYSSLQYLKQLPLDELKIDQSFVRDIAVNANDKAIVRTIIAMAQSMGMEIIAEGVETDVQRQFLAFMGCYNYQGYLFSKPVPYEQFETLLESMSTALVQAL